jgi:hypothetical protein
MIIDELFEGPQMCPECGGISFSDLILAEKKDACYYKVKASAKVWPSAYASGRLVQCRKKGAANYGNKSEGVAEGMWDQFQSIPELERAIENLIMGYKGGINLTDKGRAQLLLSINKGKRILAKKKQQQGMNEGMKARDLSMYCEKLVAEKGWDAAYKHAKFMAQGNTDPAWGSVLKYLHAMKDGVSEEQELDEKWSQKYKSSINCANPKGFSQKAHCAGRNKNEDVAEGEQQKGADYRDPKEVDYDDEYDAMVARVKKLAGLGPMKTVYDPAKRQYRNMPTAVQPKK